MAMSPTKDEVIAGAQHKLAELQVLSKYLDPSRIAKSTDANWPKAPAPLVFWLWMSQSELIGQLATTPLLDSLEAMLVALDQRRWVTGAWRERLEKLLPPTKESGFDHYSGFRSALFELNLAFRLVAGDANVLIQPDGPDRACDLLVSDSAGPFLEVEYYAPQKGVRDMYQSQLVEAWDALVTGSGFPIVTLEPAITSSNAVVEALDDYLKVGNFPDKRQQLAAAKHPSLLAIRGYGLKPNIAEVLTTPKARDFASTIDPAAWSELPSSCLGLLYCLQADALSLTSPMAAVIPIDRQPSERITAYLKRCGALHADS